MSPSKGQMFTTDLVTSAFVFIILLNVAFFALNEAQERQAAFDKSEVMQRKAFYTTSLLVRTPGHPADWEPGTVDLIGLASPDHVLQQAKIDDFDTMPYSDAKHTMDLAAYEFLVNITTPNYQKLIGQQPVNADDIVHTRRSVAVNTTNLFEQGTLTFVLWK